MKNKLFKARMEISMIVEIDVKARHEDDAAFRVGEIGNDLAAEMVSTIEYEKKGCVANYGIRCIEMEEVNHAEV